MEKLFKRNLTTKLLYALIIVCTFVLLVSPRLEHGIGSDFQANADQDAVIVGQALNVNSGKPILYFDHPGYLTHITLAYWLRLSKAIGFSSISNIDDIKNSKDLSKVFSELTATSRIYTLICLGLFIIVVGLCVYILTGNIFLSLCSGLLLSSGLGVYLESTLVRTEPLSVLLIFLALYFLLSALKGRGPTVYIKLAVAGFVSYLSMLTKTQSIFLLLALPVLAVVFAKKSNTDYRLTQRQFKIRGLYSYIVVVLAALIIGAWALWYSAALFGGTSQGIRSYHVLTLVWILAWMLFFGIVWKRSFSGVSLAFLSLCCGIFIGMMMNLVRPELEAQKSAFYFLDSMSSFMLGTTESERSASGLWSVLSLCFSRMLRANFTWEGILEYPFAIVSFVSLILVAMLVQAKFYKEALQSLSFLGLAHLLDIVFRYRWVHYDSILFTSYYYIYTDPLLVLSLFYSLSLFWGKIQKLPILKLLLCVFMIGVATISRTHNNNLYAHGYFPFYDHRQSIDDYCKFLKTYSPDVFEVIETRGKCEDVLKKEL